MFSPAHISPVSLLAIITLSGSSLSELLFCFLPPYVALASLTFQTKFSRNLMKLTSRFTQHSADESLEKQAGWLREVEEWSQKAAKLNWRFWNSPLISTLLSHTFKFWVTETCMCCFNLRGHCWSADQLYITSYAGANLVKWARLYNRCQYSTPLGTTSWLQYGSWIL